MHKGRNHSKLTKDLCPTWSSQKIKPPFCQEFLTENYQDHHPYIKFDLHPPKWIQFPATLSVGQLAILIFGKIRHHLGISWRLPTTPLASTVRSSLQGPNLPNVQVLNFQKRKNTTILVSKVEKSLFEALWNLIGSWGSLSSLLIIPFKNWVIFHPLCTTQMNKVLVPAHLASFMNPGKNGSFRNVEHNPDGI